MYNYSIGLNAVVREFQMEHLCCSCTFQSIRLCAHMYVKAIVGICFLRPRFPNGICWCSPTSFGRDTWIYIRIWPSISVKCWRLRMTSSYAREKANKGVQFEEYIECGICLGTCFKFIGNFKWVCQESSNVSYFPFSIHSKCDEFWFGNTHTEDRSISEPRPRQHKCLMDHFSANLSFFGVRLVCGVKSQSRAKSCCNLPSFNQLWKEGCASTERHNMHNVQFPLHPLGLLLLISVWLSQ